MGIDSSREASPPGRGDGPGKAAGTLAGNSLEPVAATLSEPSPALTKQPAPSQHGEPRRLNIDGQIIERLTFSKRRSGQQAELTVDVRARVEGSKTVLVRRGLHHESLATLIGADNAQRIVMSKHRGGTLDAPQVYVPASTMEEKSLSQPSRTTAATPVASGLAKQARREPTFDLQEHPNARLTERPTEQPRGPNPEDLKALQEQARQARLAFAAMVVGHGRQGAGRDESEEASLQRIDLRWTKYRASAELERQALGDLVGMAAEAMDAGQRRPGTGTVGIASGMASGIASQWADQDAKDFARLRDPGLQALAAQSIGEVMREQPAYRARLEAKALSVYREVRDLDAAAARQAAPLQPQGPTKGGDSGARPVPASKEADGVATSRVHEQAGGSSPPSSARAPTVGPATPDPTTPDPASQVELDRRAAQALREATLRAELAERYVQRDNEYRFRGEPAKVAFVDRGAKLTTQLATPSIARSMLDLAEAKGWDSLRVRGDESFRRQVWLEAGLRDVKVLGYEATAEDRDLLQRERSARQINTIEPQVEREARPERTRHLQRDPSGTRDVARSSEPEARGEPQEQTARRPVPQSASRAPADRGQPDSAHPKPQDDDAKRQVMAVLQAALKAQKVDQRTAVGVLRTAEERLDRMTTKGQALPQVRIYDRAAPREKPVQVQMPREVRERAARGR